MKSSALTLVAVLLFTVPASAQDDDSNSLDDTPHITIVGTAHEDVAPDLATITLGVVTQKPMASSAIDETSVKAQAVVAAAKAQGVSGSDIQTQSLTLTQTYDDLHDANGAYTGRKPSGFEAANIVRIRVRDLSKAGTIAQALISTGANRFDGIEFSLEHPDSVLNRLMAEAVGNAKAQAQAAAQAAGVKLGRVLQIERPGTDDGTHPVVFAARMKVAAPDSVPIDAGTSDTSVDIEVSWAIDAN